MRMMPDWAGFLQFREAFAEVMDQRYFPLEWLERYLLEGRARFWRTDKAAIIAELRAYPGGAIDVHGLIAAGDMRDVVEVLIPQAEAWGREQGCVAAEIESRPGWAKALKTHGYEVAQVKIRKELADGAE